MFLPLRLSYISVFILVLSAGEMSAQFLPSADVSRIRRIQESRTRRLFEKGIEHYDAGRYYSALYVFRQLTALHADKNSQLTASYLMTMKSYTQLEKMPDALDVGRKFLAKFPTSSYLPDVYECFGDIFVKEGHYRSAVHGYLKARSGTHRETMTSRLDEKLEHLMDGLLQKEEIGELIALELDSTSRSILMLMLAKRLLAVGDPDAAALTLFRMESTSLPPDYREIYETLRRSTYRAARESVTVGVVLPLSGYDETLGRAFLKGIRSAVDSLHERQYPEIVIEVMDNGGDNLRTISCVKILASNPNVIAIVGPLSLVNSVAAASAVDPLGVPLFVPVSTQVGLSQVSDNVFQMNPDLLKQGRYAAEYAVSSLGSDRLAVVAPADRFGKELSDGFIQRADELGAEIVSVEWYSGAPVDLSEQFESLRKVAFQFAAYHPDTSNVEVEFDTSDNTFDVSEGDFFPEEITFGERTTPLDSSQIVLSSIDGIYLPIHSGDINYVASQFSLYNLDAQLLGNTNWYDPEELRQEMIGPNVNGMIILTDYLNPFDQTTGDAAALSDFRMERRGESRMAVFGYDVMVFLAGQLGEQPTRPILLSNVRRAKPFRGVGKLFSFSDNPYRVNSSVFVLEYRKGKFLKVGEVISDSLLSYTRQSP